MGLERPGIVEGVSEIKWTLRSQPKPFWAPMSTPEVLRGLEAKFYSQECWISLQVEQKSPT